MGWGIIGKLFTLLRVCDSGGAHCNHCVIVNGPMWSTKEVQHITIHAMARSKKEKKSCYKLYFYSQEHRAKIYSLYCAPL